VALLIFSSFFPPKEPKLVVGSLILILSKNWNWQFFDSDLFLQRIGTTKFLGTKQIFDSEIMYLRN
jgi:hypothetical protein